MKSKRTVKKAVKKSKAAPKKSVQKKVRTPKAVVPSSVKGVTSNIPIRVLIAKPGLDGHDRGAKVVARALRDAGMEVIYTGLHQTPEMIVQSALQEDVQCIGLSILSGAHMTLFPAVLKLLKREKADHILVFGGGIIPRDDIEKLSKMGIKKIFLPGANTKDIVAWVRENAPKVE